MIVQYLIPPSPFFYAASKEYRLGIPGANESQVEALKAAAEYAKEKGAKMVIYVLPDDK